MTQAFVVIDQPSGEVFRIEAASYVAALEKYIGEHLSVEIIEESELASNEPERYNHFKEEGLL